MPTRPYLEIPTGKDDHYDSMCHPELTLGANPSHTTHEDSYFAFKSASAGNSWSWDGGQLTSEKTLINHGYTIKASETGGYRPMRFLVVILDLVLINDDPGTSSTSVSFESGGQKISIVGKSIFHFDLGYKDEDAW